MINSTRRGTDPQPVSGGQHRLPRTSKTESELQIPRSRRARRGLLLATGVIVSFALATNSMAATQVTVKNPGGLTASGPVNSEYGFPSWYSDSAGVRLEPCLDGENPLCGFLPGDIPDAESPVAFPDNFPEEFFYHLVSGDLTLPGGGKAVLTLGLEAAFAQGPAAPGDQVVFARTRVVVKGGPANTTLTFKHPFGELTIDTDGSGAGRLVQDISPAVGNFNAALAGNFGPFLKWDPAVAPAAPAGYVGDPGIAHKVVGGKNGYNAFSVTGGGINVETTDLTIQGKIATNTGITGDYAIAGDGYLDVFATSRGNSLQVDGVDGQYATTPLEHDDGTERQYARIKLLNGAVPTQVTVRNLGDKPASTAVIKLADLTVTKATYDGDKLTVAVKALSYPVTVVGVGTIAGNGPTDFPLAAPPATVTVKSASGAPVTYPVTVTDGLASPEALPVVPPEPSPGPVTDNTPDNPDAVVPAPVATIAAITPAVRGTTVTLDGSASTNAVSYAWTQVGGPAVTITGASTAKPTVTVPYFTATSATAPAAAAVPLTFQLTVTNSKGVTASSVATELPVQADTLTIAAGARHRIGTELRVDGTSLIGGVAGVRTPATSVVVWDVTKPAAPVKLGTAPVDSLGAWSLKLKPGPTVQVTNVLVQSTRGGTGTSSVTAK
jgi:hypothetical protein